MKSKKLFKTLPLIVAAGIALPAMMIYAQDGDAKEKGSCPAGGQCHSGKKSGPKFVDIDQNGDGKIVESEFMAAQQKRVEEMAKKYFVRMDLDENGEITETEMNLVGSQKGNKGSRAKGGKCEGGKCGGGKGDRKMKSKGGEKAAAEVKDAPADEIK